MFDLAQARRDGHTDADIAAFLAQQHGFDLGTARADGVTDAEIADFLAARPPAPAKSEPIAPAGAAPAPTKSLTRKVLERASDVGLDLTKGVVGTGEAVVGLADLLTGNAAGDLLAKVGYDPKTAQQIIASGYSPERQAENRAVADAEGFVGTTEALLDNPAVAVGSMVESAPLMLGSAGAVRAAATSMLARAGITPGTAAAAEFLKRPEVVARLATIGSAAEGATAAGSIQEGARQDGREYGESAPYALAGGVGTAAIGKVASRLLPDADVAAGTAGLGAGQRMSLPGAVARVGKGAVQEGVLEELPQSAQEQVFSNLAGGKPWDEGVAEAAAQGMVAGVGMGGGMAAANVAAQTRPAGVADEIEQRLQQRETEAAATGDPLEVAVTRAENAAVRRAAQPPQAAPIDLDALTQQIATLDDDSKLVIARMLAPDSIAPAPHADAGVTPTALPAEAPFVPAPAPDAALAPETPSGGQIDPLGPVPSAVVTEKVPAPVGPTVAPMVPSQAAPASIVQAEAATEAASTGNAVETPAAASAEIAQPAPVAPLLMSNGKPFGSEKLAATSARQRKLDMVPVEVKGGWGLVPVMQRAPTPAAVSDFAPVEVATPDETAAPVVVNPPGQAEAIAPSAAPVQRTPRPRATRDTLRAVAAERLPSLNKTIASLIERGDAGKRGGVVVVATEADLPATNIAGASPRPITSRGPDGRVRGLYDPASGLSYLVSENVDADEALAVLLHEATHGQQRAEIDAKAQRLLDARERAVQPVREFLNRVAQRIDEAGEAGNPSETTAYIVEQAVIEGRQAGFSAVDGKFMRWIDQRMGKRIGNTVRDFVAMVRAWGLRRGVAVSPSIDDLVALARHGLKQAARGRVAFAEENRRLREQDRTLWAKAKKQLRRQLSPGGLLPENVFHEKISRDNELNALEFDIRHIVGRLEQAVLQDFGMAIGKLSEAQQRELSEALAGKVAENLPEATKTAIVAMRQYIDGLSADYVQILDEQIAAKLEQGGEADADLRDKIASNVGQYVNRSYRAFDDPKWFKKVSDRVLSDARAFLRDGYRESGETEAESARLAEVALHEILKNGTAYDSMESFIAEGKLGAKDLSVLMRRKNVPPEIRALLGEYVDPRMNFAKSAGKMGRLIWNQRFLDRVREVGMGAFLFEGTGRPPEATAQIAAEGSETYSPLNGLWTFPEVAQAFKDALGKEQMADWYRVIVRMNGLVKYGKTVLSPTTAMRNWQSAMFFAIANGHFDLTQMRKSVAAFREQVAQRATGDDLAYLRHLKRLGVVYDSPYAGEMQRLLNDSQIEDLLNTGGGTVLRGFRKANQMAQGFYSFGDDFWKIIGFENEKASLLKAGLSPQEAETEAARRIRNTYPTYSLVGRAARALSRFPLAGTFVSFPAEIIRTTGNMLATVASDLRSDNPGLRRLGMRRAVGMALVAGGFRGASALSRVMFGVDDDEEEALRDLAPPWQKNSTFLYVGRDENGRLRYFDLSFLDPYGYWKRPITALLRNQPWEEAAASSVADMLSPFLGADISAEAIYRVFSNKSATGGKIYPDGPGVSPADQLVAISDYLRKALQPGVMGNAERIAQAAQGRYREGSGQPYSLEDELVALLGWRASTVDPKTALRYRSFEFGDHLGEARRVASRVLRSQNEVRDGDIADALSRGEAMHGKAFEQMRRVVVAARKSGMDDGAIRSVLDAGGVSRQNVEALLRGDIPPFRLSQQAAEGAARQAELTRDRAHAQDIQRRFRVANELSTDRH